MPPAALRASVWPQHRTATHLAPELLATATKGLGTNTMAQCTNKVDV